MAERVSEPATLALRVAFPPTPPQPPDEQRYPWGPGRASRRPDVLLLAVEVGDDQELVAGRWRRKRFGRVIAEGLIVPDGISDAAMVEILAWADAHPVRLRFARGAQLTLDRLSVWAEEVLRPAITASSADDGRPVGGRAWIFAWDAPRVISRLVRAWGPAQRTFYGGWSLGMFDEPGAPGAGSGHPRVRIRQLRDGLALISWGGTPTNKKGKRPTRLPPILDLRHLTNALAGPGITTLVDACAAFEVDGPTRDGSVHDRLASQLDAIDALQRALLREVDVWNAG
jgi:hypothetical protein